MHTNTTPAPARKRRIGRIALAAALPVALFSGCVGGVAISDGSSTDEAAATAEPQPTATVTATPEPAPTVTETAEPVVETVTETAEPEEVEVEVEVEVVPQSCLDAIDAGDEIIDITMVMMDAVADAFHAASIGDLAGMDDAVIRMEAQEGPIGDAGFDWGFWSEACKDGS